MERGFTLVELLAAIVIVALISILVFPSILNQFTKSKGTVNETAKEAYVNATELYLDNNVNLQQYIVDTKICVSFEVLVNNGNLKEPIKNLETGRNMDIKTNGVQVTYHASTEVINDGVVGGLTSLDCDVKITN